MRIAPIARLSHIPGFLKSGHICLSDLQGGHVTLSSTNTQISVFGAMISP